MHVALYFDLITFSLTGVLLLKCVLKFDILKTEQVYLLKYIIS